MKYLINKLFYAAYQKELCGLAKEARKIKENKATIFSAGQSDGIILTLETLGLIK